MVNCIHCGDVIEYSGPVNMLPAHKAKKKFCSSYCQAMKWKYDNPFAYRFTRWKAMAKKNGREFSIQMEDLTWPTHCAYLGVELKYLDGQKLGDSASLDRIDSSKGYIKGNVQIISDLANAMKNMATEDQLVVFAKSILEMYNAKAN